MSKAKTAKTASKNNPTSRMKAAEVFYNDKKIEPVLVLVDKRRYMSGAFEDGSLPMDTNGFPLPWSDLVS